MSFTYIIIDDSQESALDTKATAQGFSELEFLGMAFTLEQGVQLILEKGPDLVFLEIAPGDEKSKLSLFLISELHRFLAILPAIIITTTQKEYAFEAIDYGVFDYFLKPVSSIQLLKTLHKLRKKEPFLLPQTETRHESNADARARVQLETQAIPKPLTICIKSYGDYRYIVADEITHFEADNNSTDIYLKSGEKITAFKTLKHFESMLVFPFVRIHNSFIVNSHWISRIQMGNSQCFIRNSSIKIPFSKTYKTNVDIIISGFSDQNYIEF